MNLRPERPKLQDKLRFTPGHVRAPRTLGYGSTGFDKGLFLQALLSVCTHSFRFSFRARYLYRAIER